MGYWEAPRRATMTTRATIGLHGVLGDYMATLGLLLLALLLVLVVVTILSFVVDQK